MSRLTETWPTELKWASRNLRQRGWRATLAIGLLTIALAANAIVFSAADSLVFQRIPYKAAERLVEIHGGWAGEFMSPALLDEWRRQTDLFSGVQGYVTSNLFLVGDREAEMVLAADLSVGLLEVLGTGPRWGRGFISGDDREMALQPVLIAESLARRRFGEPSAAIGQRLLTTGEPLVVIGVMPAGFEFPNSGLRIWRAFDPRGPLARNTLGVTAIARIADGVTPVLLARMMEQRSSAIGATASTRGAYAARPAPLRASRVATEQRSLLFVLMAAGLCLLLLACANVASLELASVAPRARAYAIQLAVGASRGGLARTALVEGACLVGAATSSATALAYGATEALSGSLPPQLIKGTANPIDFDERTLLFMAAAAAAVWVLTSLPVVLYASRANLMELLRLEGHLVRSSARAGLIRGSLTVVQVAVTVMLLSGSVVYVRSYLALLALDKGFDASGVLTIKVSIPPQLYAANGEQRALGREAAERLRARPGVSAAADLTAPPSMGTVLRVTELAIDDRPPFAAEITMAEIVADRDYFSVLRIPLLAGRFFQADEPDTNVIVGETFANQYWPDGAAVGQRFRRDGATWFTVVGVVGHVRSSTDPPGGRSARRFQTYVPRQPPPPLTRISAPRSPATGGTYGFLNLMARVDSRLRARDLYQTIQALDRRLVLKLDFVDDLYAQQFGDRLLATQVIGGFGTLAFVVAVAGIYGLMTFLVAHRTPEIGIRIALGAKPSQISGLVLGSSVRLIAIGAALGMAGAAAVSAWVQSQLFGVRALDPITLAGVSALVVVTGLLATWEPARRAARIDPVVLLRN